MSRLKRKFRTDVKLAPQGGMLDLFDNAIQVNWRINNAEFDYIAENISKEDMYLFITDEYSSVTEKKHIINVVNNLIDKFNKEDE